MYLIFEKCPKYLRECIPQCPGILPHLIMTTIISFLSSIYIELLDGLSLLESDKATDTELSIIAVQSLLPEHLQG